MVVTVAEDETGIVSFLGRHGEWDISTADPTALGRALAHSLSRRQR